MFKGFQVFGQGKRKKIGVMIGMPVRDGWTRPEIARFIHHAAMLSAMPDHPYFYDPVWELGVEPLEDARNRIVRRFLEKTQHRYLFFLDDDQLPPDNWTELVGKGDFVTGVTWMWRPEQPPQQRILLNQTKLNDAGHAIPVGFMPPVGEGPYEIDCVGLSCAVLSREMLTKLGPNPFRQLTGEMGEIRTECDLQFCRKARAEGFRVIVMRDVVFDHIYQVSLMSVIELVRFAVAHAATAGAHINKREVALESQGVA